MVKDIFSIRNKLVVLTGGNGLIGKQLARFLLQFGARVAIIDREFADHHLEHVDSISERGHKSFIFCKCDITDKVALEQTAGEICSKFGTPDAIINNAAIDSPPNAPLEESGPFESYPESSWDKVLDVNLKGTFLVCQVIGSEMAKKGSGSIVNVSSIYGLVSPDQSIYQYRRDRGETFYKPVAYSASKSGILNLSRYLAAYWGRSGVRVNTLTLAGVFNSQDEEFLKAYTARIPLGRMAHVEDYLGAFVYLISDSSQYMTGSNLVIDGGWTAI
jgi:NAD(P)-dependent dehydrogenase (short-subunit alcohol dehydrogenase family)